MIVAGWGGIIFSKLYIGGTAAQYTGFVATLIKNLPTVVPTAVNGILPQVIAFSINLEAWDDPSTKLKNFVARLYAAKILNALIQVAVVLIFFSGPIPLLGGQRVLLRDCNYATCEDQMGITFFTLFMTDVLIGTVSSIAISFGTWGAFRSLNKPKLMYNEFKPPVQIIKVCVAGLAALIYAGA